MSTDNKRPFLILLLMMGLSLIVICFLHFGAGLETSTLILDIAVTGSIYALSFLGLFLPWLGNGDHNQKRFGGMGARWFFSLLYMLLAIGVMVSSQNALQPLDFHSQLLLQLLLVFLMICGLYFSYQSSQKVEQIAEQQQIEEKGVLEMKKIAQDVQNKIISNKNAPYNVKSKILSLLEDTRYISYTKNVEAKELENEFIYKMKSISSNLLVTPIDYERLMVELEECERFISVRKRVYYN